MDTTQELLGTSDLAERFNYSPSAIKLLDRLGVLPASRRVANRRVWGRDQLPLIESAIKARRGERRQEESGKAA